MMIPLAIAVVVVSCGAAAPGVWTVLGAARAEHEEETATMGNSTGCGELTVALKTARPSGPLLLLLLLLLLLVTHGGDFRGLSIWQSHCTDHCS